MIKILQSLIGNIPVFDLHVADVITSKAHQDALRLKKLAEYFKWNNLLFLKLKPFGKGFFSLFEQYYQESINVFQESNKCFHFYEVDRNWTLAKEQRFTKDWIEKSKPSIIIFEPFRKSLKILKELKNLSISHQIPVIVHDSMTKNYDDIVYNFKGPIIELFDFFRAAEYEDIAIPETLTKLQYSLHKNVIPYFRDNLEYLKIF